MCLVPLHPRRKGCSVVEGKDITKPKVEALAAAADRCWDAIMAKDLSGFASAFRASFEAQVAMFPGMVTPTIVCSEEDGAMRYTLQPDIDKWNATAGVLALKFTGAGGGGYLALVVEDTSAFCSAHAEAIALRIRRN